jgi:hypothetical protein
MPITSIHPAKNRIANRLKKKGVKSLSDTELKKSLSEKMLPLAISWRREDYKQIS